MILKNTFTILLFICFVNTTQSQTYVELIEFADKKVKEGDFYHAILYYNQAANIDSNSIELNWKLAEVNRYYKDYQKASYYYQKVYQKEQARIYPHSVFWLAKMLQYNGNYIYAKQAYKSAKKVFKRDRESADYIKSVQGFKACLWAINASKNTSTTKVKTIGKPVNSYDAELAPIIHGNQLYFTSLKADSVLKSEEVISKNYSLQLFKAKKFKHKFTDITQIKGLDTEKYHFANGTFSQDGKRFYFSRCDNNLLCKIFVGEIDGDRLINIDSLGEIINEDGAHTTMPHISIINGQEYLFFVSDRYRTLGGLDIWMSAIKNGNQYSEPYNLGKRINTIEDDISPFFDHLNNRLYFSSSWHLGFGGQDIFYCQMIDHNWRFNSPVNLGLPINSSQNDTYFIIDTLNRDFYFSSNRKGVNYTKNPTCCNDIFLVNNSKLVKPNNERFPNLEALNKKLPVTLYFHNDEPNPKTTDTTTHLNYIETYRNYSALKNKYKREYSKGLIGDLSEEAKEDIGDFFIEYVEQGVVDLKEFSRLLLIELKKGQKLVITVKGFASPLAKSDYNVKLTKRRIQSFVNYLSEHDNGTIKHYINNGSLSFEAIPFGEYTASTFVSDNVNDKKNSIYNRKAALERKIEIQSVSINKNQ